MKDFAGIGLSAGATLPGFLVKPDDPISNMMYGNNLSEIRDEKCNYCIGINGNYYDLDPEIKTDSDFEVIHIYSKPETPSWQMVTTIHTPAVQSSPLEDAVLHKYNLSNVAGDPIPMPELPKGRKADAYESIKLLKLGSWPEFDIPRGLDQSLVFCHIFRLNGEVFKDYMIQGSKA